MSEPGVAVRLIGIAQTLPLRLAVLRPGRPIEAARFAGDEDSDTRHVGVFRGEELVGIASLYRAAIPQSPGSNPNEIQYQLRGMAVAPQVQRSGYGGVLLKGCIDFARSAGATILWCNARTSAVDFYRKFGFEVLGEEFVIPDVGPHFRMKLKP